MAFWENIGQKASETTAKAVQKAKDMSEIARLNSQITEEEGRINSAYMQIGKLYFEKYHEVCDPDFTSLIKTIADGGEKVKALKQQINAVKGVVICEKCGAEVQAGSLLCNSCGAAMPKPAEADPMEGMTKCGKCGAMIPTGSRFCTACGAQMEQKPAMEAGGDMQSEEAGQQVNTATAEETSVEEAEAPKETGKTVCPNCGAAIAEGDLFCVECGTKI